MGRSKGSFEPGRGIPEVLEAVRGGSIGTLPDLAVSKLLPSLSYLLPLKAEEPVLRADQGRYRKGA